MCSDSPFEAEICEGEIQVNQQGLSQNLNSAMLRELSKNYQSMGVMHMPLLV